MHDRILIVEPYVAIRELLEACLRRAQHDVAAVDDGNEALAAMEREHFPCVVVGSPVVVHVHGEHVLFLEYIEQHCPEWKPCLVVVTTHVEAGDVTAVSRRLRVCAVLGKPFASEDLLEAVDGCLFGRHAPTRWIGIKEPRPAPAAYGSASR
jgi:DNA-binding NtrC family response regulator